MLTLFTFTSARTGGFNAISPTDIRTFRTYLKHFGHCPVADSGGARGARSPPLGNRKIKKCPINGKFVETTEKFCYYPPTESRRLLETTEKFCYYPPHWIASAFGDHGKQKFCYYPPPPPHWTESRLLGTSHERGPLFRKILDLRLLSFLNCNTVTILDMLMPLQY